MEIIIVIILFAVIGLFDFCKKKEITKKDNEEDYKKYNVGDTLLCGNVIGVIKEKKITAIRRYVYVAYRHSYDFRYVYKVEWMCDPFDYDGNTEDTDKLLEMSQYLCKDFFFYRDIDKFANNYSKFQKELGEQ